MLADQMDKVHPDPVDELYAGGAVQSHGGDLPDDDRLSAGQGFAIRPARASFAARFSHMGCHISKMKPPDGPMLPFVEMPRPLQESSVIGKGGAAGFLGKAYDPYRLYQDPNKEPID